MRLFSFHPCQWRACLYSAPPQNSFAARPTSSSPILHPIPILEVWHYGHVTVTAGQGRVSRLCNRRAQRDQQSPFIGGSARNKRVVLHCPVVSHPRSPRQHPIVMQHGSDISRSTRSRSQAREENEDGSPAPPPANFETIMANLAAKLDTVLDRLDRLENMRPSQAPSPVPQSPEHDACL